MLDKLGGTFHKVWKPNLLPLTSFDRPTSLAEGMVSGTDSALKARNTYQGPNKHACHTLAIEEREEFEDRVTLVLGRTVGAKSLSWRISDRANLFL